MKKNKNSLFNNIIELPGKNRINSINKPIISRISTLFNKISSSFNKNFFDEFSDYQILTINKKNIIDNEFLENANIHFVCVYIAIIAKLAIVDGDMNKFEEKEFFSDFINKNYNIVNIRNYLNLAFNDKNDFGYYIRKLKVLFPNNKILYEKIIIKMLYLAESDSPINIHEMKLIKNAVNEFKISPSNFERIFYKALSITENDDPYFTLNISKNISKDDLTIIYRNIAKKYHPDNYITYKDVSDEYKIIMQGKFDIYTKAYIKIKNKK